MRSIRISIMITTLLLISLGIIMIYSSSGIFAQQNLNNHFYFLQRHLIFLSIGSVLMIGMMVIDYQLLQKYAKPLLIIVIILLIAVLIPGIGRSSFGARRWLSVGPFSFQPSELAKLAMIFYTADFLSRKKFKITSFRKGFLPILLVLGVVSALIVKEPDLGNTLSIGVVTVLLIFIGGCRWQHIMSLMLLAVPVLAVMIIKVPYRMRRIVAFLNPWADPQGVGFQLTQSQIAFGSGGLLGKGLGKSVQKLFYLPAAHTDFILSIVGEELGFLGVLCVILLFANLIWQGARVVKRTEDPFGYYVALGIVLMLGFQSVVNIGVSIGALPTKGLPLPFISYGGSALIFNMAAVGLLLNISKTEDLKV